MGPEKVMQVPPWSERWLSVSQVKRRKEKVIQMEEREGAGLTLSWALPEPRELAKEKGDKGSDHRGRWGDKTDPTVLKPGIGVLKKGRVKKKKQKKKKREGSYLSILLGGGGPMPLSAILLGSLAPAPPPPLLDSCPSPLFIYCTNLSYSPQPEA